MLKNKGVFLVLILIVQIFLVSSFSLWGMAVSSYFSKDLSLQENSEDSSDEELASKLFSKLPLEIYWEIISFIPIRHFKQEYNYAFINKEFAELLNYNGFYWQEKSKGLNKFLKNKEENVFLKDVFEDVLLEYDEIFDHLIHPKKSLLTPEVLSLGLLPIARWLHTKTRCKFDLFGIVERNFKSEYNHKVFFSTLGLKSPLLF